ncbi:MAG: ATP-binding cassette domain-containing protein [Phycisphaerae bacterium]|jgi:ABC-type lipoprotein export system ATPase subunit|nr:ATP-binding cassette domain-containing protein [Phycisphaerae bacterium]
MKIQSISILGGVGKDQTPDFVGTVQFQMGQIVSIVGPTGSGKTTLINDLELFADRNTPSQRKILINDLAAPEIFSNGPARHPIALITQHTNFLSDMAVGKFLTTHASVRRRSECETVVDETLNFANQLTGEAINPDSAMTELSGGQTRALLIADAVVIGNSPIILLDEIENAGIHRTKALELLKDYEKIFIFVTHDPRIALLSDFRIVMKNGAMQKIIHTGEEEKRVVEEIKKMDDLLLEFRTHIRNGLELTESLLEDRLRAMGYLE